MTKPISVVYELVKQLSSLPGVGGRSAQRIALHLLLNKEKTLAPLISNLQGAYDDILECDQCGNIDKASPCQICQDNKRKDELLCVVESVADLWAIERSGSYLGRYHVLGGVLSPLSGVTPEDLRLTQLVERVESSSFTEVILALSATVDGQTTAHYISDSLISLANKPVISRLAHGVPMGGELDYLDEGTITTALKARGQI